MIQCTITLTAQQIHYPANPRQSGLIYFKTLRKCSIFGVNCEGVKEHQEQQQVLKQVQREVESLQEANKTLLKDNITLNQQLHMLDDEKKMEYCDGIGRIRKHNQVVK